MTRTIAAVALLASVFVGVAALTPVEAAGPGEYSDPTWYPLRGTSTVGCSYGTSCASGHHGYYAVDLMQAKGSPIHPAGAGQVTRVDTAGSCPGSGYGRLVEVDHGNGVKTRYAHLDTIAVTVGTWVDPTTQIGTVGATGSVSSCTAYHLHFEKWVNGVRVAPNALKGCNGTTYPSTWGYSTWNQVPGHTKTITNTASCSSTPTTTTPTTTTPTTPPPTPSWETVRGTLVQIAHGPQGEIWGVNAAGNLYQYAGNHKWTKRGEGYRHVTIGKAPDAGGPNVYALTASGEIRRTRNNTTFETVRGTLVQIDHGPDGEIWGVNAAGNLYQYAGNHKWTKRGEGYRHVTTGTPSTPGGPSVYALTNAGAIKASTDGTNWTSINGTLVDIDLGPQGELWGVNAAGWIYRRTDSNAWAFQDTGFSNVSLGIAPDAGGPYVYAVNTSGQIKRRR